MANLCFSLGTPLVDITKVFFVIQRQALPARAGLGGQSHQTPNPPLGLNHRKCGQNPALVRCTRCWALLCSANSLFWAKRIRKHTLLPKAHSPYIKKVIQKIRIRNIRFEILSNLIFLHSRPRSNLQLLVIKPKHHLAFRPFVFAHPFRL